MQKLGAMVKWFPWPKEAPGAKGIDDLLAAIGPEKVLSLIASARPTKVTLSDQQSSAKEFAMVSEDHYRLAVPGIFVTFEIDRLRRERGELIGELAVQCELPGARTTNGYLSIADFNLSSARSRLERSRILSERSNAGELDWTGLLEDFSQRVLQADRNGQPAVELWTLPKPDHSEAEIKIDGLAFPRQHPSILFGDGGSAKSYTALYIAGQMAKLGIKVALFDWEKRKR
jgi:hypothetical protein